MDMSGKFTPAEAFDTIEETILPSLALVLDSLIEAAALGTPSVVVAGDDNAAAELIEEGVNGFVAPSAAPDAIAAAIVACVEGGAELRERTAAWFAENAPRLTVDSSARTVDDWYSRSA